MTQAEKERAAIDAGFWFAKNGNVRGQWVVGKDTARLRALPEGSSRTDARKAMVETWEDWQTMGEATKSNG